MIISTHTPLAGRNYQAAKHLKMSQHFYSHAPRGAQRDCPLSVFGTAQISTHTPLAGRNQIGQTPYCSYADFYSHAPRGAQQEVIHIGYVL